jgi:amino-acid N-acetyltransferase
MHSLHLRKARVQDVRGIHGLLMESSQLGELLPRSFSELYTHLRDFYVLAADQGEGPIVGCCALTISWEDLAEVRSLMVAPELRGQGWGRRLVEACLSECVTLGIYKSFVLTYQVAFFTRMGFHEVAKDVLPHKIWADCLKCMKFPECDEIAMLMEM